MMLMLQELLDIEIVKIMLEPTLQTKLYKEVTNGASKHKT